jgi:hypothetical protein
MKKLMSATLSFVCLTSLVCLAQGPANQDNAKETSAQEKSEQKPMPSRTVTGCLQKGELATEFSITGEDGRTWDLSGNAVKLDDHVGHQVAVTGSAQREPKATDKAEDKKDGQMVKAADKEGYGDLRVTDLKMISDTCASK